MDWAGSKSELSHLGDLGNGNVSMIHLLFIFCASTPPLNKLQALHRKRFSIKAIACRNGPIKVKEQVRDKTQEDYPTIQT